MNTRLIVATLLFPLMAGSVLHADETVPLAQADGFGNVGDNLGVFESAAPGRQIDNEGVFGVDEPAASRSAPVQTATDAKPAPVPADWVRHEKFGATFAAPPDFVVQTDDAELLQLWSGPENPRISTPGFSITMAEIDEDAFDRYEGVFVKATERFEVDLGFGAVFKAKRLIQGSDGVPYGHLTLAALSKEPIAGDKHLVITISSTRIEPETALPLMDGIFATFKMTGPLGSGATDGGQAAPPPAADAGDENALPESGGTPVEKFGLSFTAPPGFKVELENDDELVVANNSLDTPEGCGIVVFLQNEKDPDIAPPTVTMETLPDRILGENERFESYRLSGELDGVQIGGNVLASTNPVVAGRYLVFSLSCGGDAALLAPQVFSNLLPSLHYATLPGTGSTTPIAPADVAPAASPNAEIAAPGPTAPRPRTAADPAIELAFWDTIKQSNDPADFQAYLDQFPDGVFATLARNKMKRLGDGGAPATTATATVPTPPVAANPAAQATAPQGAVDYAGDHDWTYYYNDRYGTSIEYPVDIFGPQAPPTNNDGRRFESRDGLAGFYVFAEYNALAQSLAELFNEDQTRAGEQVTYKKKGSGWFVVSGYRGSNIFYRKTTLSGDDLLQVFEIFYQTDLAQAFNPIVTRMAQSFPGAASNSGNSGTVSSAAPNPPSSSSRADYYTPAWGTDERKAIMDAARGPVSNDIGQTVTFVVKVLRSDGRWAYLQGTPVQLNGNPLNWATTRYAADWNADVMSDTVMVLLNKDSGQWQTVDHIVGPTDVFWYSWIDQYGLPPALFGG